MSNKKRKKLESKKKEFKQKLKKSIDDLDTKDRSKLKAIAIKYDEDKGKAPQIIATGKGKIAESIINVASENNIPLYEDQTLANVLSKLELESEIPKELFGVFAELLAFIYHLEKMASKRSRVRDRFAKFRKGKS